MAKSVNKVFLVGNLGQDPKVVYTNSGKAVCSFDIATNERFGETEKTEWHRIVTWQKLAELCGEYLAKGRSVHVEGRLQTRDWIDKDGVKRWKTEIVAKEITFLGGRKDDSPDDADEDVDEMMQELDKLEDRV